ncbi:hypothetical protein ARMGADRAFT_960438 [Armillaria gallica]|uniref:Uncharacterized protein n=1 Tax=Armillaria gallica TaxID=47427 RepID=A0A2H3DXI9_ARMGA|nr:hypothetical protein ARMGADRAFT_960438 [Armillaria gallica]
MGHRTSLSCFSGKSAVALNIFSTVDWSTIIAFAVVVSTRISDSWILKSQGIVPTAFNHSRLFLCFFWVSRLRHEASLVIASFALRARLGLG